MSYVFNFYAGLPAEGMNVTPPLSRPRAIRAGSEGNSPRRHHRHRRRHRHRSRSRHQRGDVQNPIGVPQQRAPAPSPPPVTTPPGDPFRNSPPPFVQPPPPRSATPHRGEPPVRAESAPVERARPASSSRSEVPPRVWFGSNTPPPGAWLSGPPGSWRPQPPRPVVPPQVFLSEPLRPNYLPPKAPGGEPSSTSDAGKKPSAKPATNFNVKCDAAPATPPYNPHNPPPVWELKATPKKREKKHEPGQASTGTPPAVEKSADEMLDEELRKTNAQSSTDQPNDADLEQPFLDGHAATGAELLQQSGVAESTETFDTKDPLTPFLGYVLFVLQHRNNPFSDSDSWLIFKHSEMREFAIGNELL